jgi:sugar lactone lactonase YvrE
MKRELITAVAMSAALLAALPAQQAQAWNRGHAQTFATLPEGAGNPEGITVDAQGNLYVSTFAPLGTPSGAGEVHVFRSNGKLARTLVLPGTSTLLLELAFHPLTGDLLVIDFGTQRVLRVNPLNGDNELFASIPGGAAAGPNVLTFDNAGNVYVSDSFQGTIWVTDANGVGDAPGVAAEWLSDPLLQTAGVPPFGANGLAFDADESALYVANTGDDRVLRVPVGLGGNPAGPVEVFVNSVNGADGIIFDDAGNLWIAANQADEIVVVDPSGRAIAKLGDFAGLSRKGEPQGLLFPASLVRHRGFIYVTNLALDIRLFGLAQSPDSQWAADVTRHTVARIRARIPGETDQP